MLRLRCLELIHSIFDLLYPSQAKFAKSVQNFVLGKEDRNDSSTERENEIDDTDEAIGS